MSTQTLPEALALCRELDLLPRGSHILCAVSGGADSVCLLHWLNALRSQFGFSLTAAHYDHGLRGEESRRDAAFVRSFVETCCPDVPLITGCGDVAGQAARNKTGLEETARDMRYTFLRETAQQVGADRIATAHNAQDNAETLLLHLIRGSGLRGLTGIQPLRDEVIRPLLTTRRETIEEYLRIYGLPHVEDSSNTDERFTRNRVRRQLLPLLEAIQPRFVEHAGQTACLLSQDEEYLTDLAQQALPPVQPVPDGLSAHAPSIAAQPDPIAVRMLRLLLNKLTQDGSNYSAAHLQAAVTLCRGSDPSAQISLPNGIVLRRVYDRLELVQDTQPEFFPCTPLPLPGTLTLSDAILQVQRIHFDNQLQTPHCLYLSCAKLSTGLTVRPRRSGDELERPTRPRKSLKKLLIDEKIPRHMRDRLPVLDCGGHVAAVIGLGPDTAFLPAPGEECWEIRYTSQTQKGSL